MLRCSCLVFLLGCILTYYPVACVDPVTGMLCYDFAALNVTNDIYHCSLPTPLLVYELMILSGNCPPSYLAATQFNLDYVDGTDVMGTKQNYSMAMGDWDGVGMMSINLQKSGGLIYTKEFDLTPYHSVQKCSEAIVYVRHSCLPSALCPENWCQNGGTCINKDTCHCALGFFGPRCASSLSDLGLDSFEFSSLSGGVLSSPSGMFNTSGGVGLTKPGVISLTDSGRIEYTGSGPQTRRHADARRHNNHHYHSSGHFGPNNGHYHGFYSQHSHSYTHSCSVGFHHNHDHSHPVYMYSTHGSNHHSNGASLHYCNGYVNMHVHNQHGHCSTSARLPPHGPQGQHHVITSTYSPHQGCAIYVNGQHMCGNAPTPAPVVSTTAAPVSQPLCMGSCGHFSGPTPKSNMSLAHPTTATTSLSVLAANQMLAILGSLVRALLQQNNQNLPTTPVPTTTQTPPTTLPMTQPTTPLPTTRTTTMAPASATSATSASSTLQCYQCNQMRQDGLCTSLTTCRTGQVCAVFNDTKGYTHECLDKQVCELSKALTLASCWTCCETDRCNANCPKPCVDDPKCATLKSTNYAVCGNAKVANDYCPKTCSLC